MFIFHIKNVHFHQDVCNGAILTIRSTVCSVKRLSKNTHKKLCEAIQANQSAGPCDRGFILNWSYTDTQLFVVFRFSTWMWINVMIFAVIVSLFPNPKSCLMRYQRDGQETHQSSYQTIAWKRDNSRKAGHLGRDINECTFKKKKNAAGAFRRRLAEGKHFMMNSVVKDGSWIIPSNMKY